MIDTEQEPSRQSPGAWQRIRTDAGKVLRMGLVVIFSLVTLVLCMAFSGEMWNGSYPNLGLAGAAVLVGLLALRAWWLGRHRQPALLGWFDRKQNWILGAWGLILAAVIFGLVLQDQAHTREGKGFRSAMDRIEASSALADRLGSPIRAGWWVSGGQSMSKLGSYWFLEFSISGPKGSGKVCARTLYVQQYKEREIQSESVLVTVDRNGECIELVKPRPTRNSR